MIIDAKIPAVERKSFWGLNIAYRVPHLSLQLVFINSRFTLIMDTVHTKKKQFAVTLIDFSHELN